MTLDEAIKHAEEVAKEQDKLCKRYDDASGYTRSHNEDIRTTDAKKCAKCAEEHRQLAEWLEELKELKEYKEQSGDAISRREALNAITMAEVRWQAVDNVNKLPPVSPQQKIDAVYIDGFKAGYSQARFDLEQEPSVTPQQKTERWIPLEYDGYADGNPIWDKWECSKCGWEHSGDEESLTAFCPNCGAKMESEDGEQ